jgi:hypothetical protein
MTSTTRTRARTLGTALAAAALLAIGLTASATAAGSGAVVVQGIQEHIGTCGNEAYGPDGYKMDGDLEGCWWITGFDNKSAFGKHNLIATGTEHFEGWLFGQWGTFETTYTYTAKFDGAWDEGAAEIHGRCHHPVTQGTGVFAGVHGEISFHDDLSGADPQYPYWGPLQLAKGALDAASTSASRSGAAAKGASDPATC